MAGMTCPGFGASHDALLKGDAKRLDFDTSANLVNILIKLGCCQQPIQLTLQSRERSTVSFGWLVVRRLLAPWPISWLQYHVFFYLTNVAS